LKYRLSFVLILLSVSFIFISCEDEPSSIGIQLIAGELLTVKTFDSFVDSVAQSSSYFKNVVALGNSSYLLLGIYQDIEASALLRFIFGLSDSLKTDVTNGNINVIDSWVVLTNRYVYGDTLAAMDFTAHKVNSSWSSSGYTIDSLPILQYDMQDISSGLNITDTNYTFNLDEAVVLSWMKNAADNTIESNYGIYLKPSAASGKVIGFEALTALSSDAAELYVVIEKPGVYTDTINGFIIGDISLVDGELPGLPAERIAVQSGIAVNSKIKFDLSALPDDIVINDAELILTEDTLSSMVGSGYSNSLKAFYLQYSDSLNTQGSSVTLLSGNNKFSGSITAFLRNWVLTGENNGLLIQTGNQTDGLELFALYASDSADLSLRPRLIITYSIKENQ